MNKIKICGTRRIEDIEVYNRFKIDYAGFIFAKKSPRYIAPHCAAELIRHLCGIRPVGVFVNSELDEIREIAKLCRLDIIQLHGDEDAEFVTALKAETGLEVWRAVKMRGTSSLDIIKSYPSDRFLLDTYTPHDGGSGKSFDWGLTDGLDMNKIIIAGGLAADNAADAAKLGAYALDLNSRLETDGFKDAAKIAAAIKAIREG